MPLVATAANHLWMLANARAARQFEVALRHPAEVQQHILLKYLRNNAATAFGSAHGFANIASVEEFQQRVPITRYEDYTPYITRIAAGEPNVLTREPVRHFAVTSGSSGAEKLIPYTRSLLREFSRGIAPWIANLFDAYPTTRGGPAYWSISPAGSTARSTPFSVARSTPFRAARSAPFRVPPVGFDEDSAYLGGIFKRIIDGTLAVPAAVRTIADIDTFRYVTLLCLLRTPELRLMSVWHPSFLTLLLTSAEPHWDRLLQDIRDGTLHPTAALSATAARALAARPNSRRAAELKSAGPHAVAAFWPRLAVVSCWSHAAAQAPAKHLAALFPHAVVQGKGLLATEGFVSLPHVADGTTHHPLAIRSHFFELLANNGKAILPEHADVGGEYTMLLTTAGGFYRYHTGDRVRVTGRLHKTPCIEFLGKEDLVVDRFGEKLNALFVQAVLTELRTFTGETPFIMLAPDAAGYTLFIECGAPCPPDLAARLDALLAKNPQYAYCRRLGQLTAARVFQIEGPAAEAYLEACRSRGQRLGDIKPTALHRGDWWSEVFRGAYMG